MHRSSLVTLAFVLFFMGGCHAVIGGFSGRGSDGVAVAFLVFGVLTILLSQLVPSEELQASKLTEPEFNPLPSPRSLTPTFAELGIPFLLFAAPVADASGYLESATCIQCKKTKRHLFCLGLSDELIVSCCNCGISTPLVAGDRDDGFCIHCKHTVSFPQWPLEEVAVCYTCLRNGQGAFLKTTESETIDWESAQKGRTQWEKIHLSSTIMSELLRTPSYFAVHGNEWLFCCHAPMVFLGRWSRDDFVRRAHDQNGKACFSHIISDEDGKLWRGFLADWIRVYVFKCATCGAEKANSEALYDTVLD